MEVHVDLLLFPDNPVEVGWVGQVVLDSWGGWWCVVSQCSVRGVSV